MDILYRRKISRMKRMREKKLLTEKLKSRHLHYYYTTVPVLYYFNDQSLFIDAEHSLLRHHVCPFLALLLLVI